MVPMINETGTTVAAVSSSAIPDPAILHGRYSFLKTRNSDRLHGHNN
jgi:hypothetical protein